MPSSPHLLLRVSLRPALSLLLLLGLYVVVTGASLQTYTVANATLTVTDCSGETGPGRIGTVISSASIGDTITFSCSGTIPLTSTLVIRTNNLTLDGSGQAVILDGRGGVIVLSVKSGITFTLNALTVANGKAGFYSNGGGLANYGTVSISNSTFTYNTGPFSRGGGLFNAVGAIMSVSDSTIANNSASAGGGIENYGRMSISNSTIVNNSAGFGGGIESLDGSMSILNSTIANNSGIGGGIETFFPVRIGGSIVGDNSDDDCLQYSVGTITDRGYNLSSDSSCSFMNTGSLQNTNPQFDPDGLQNNGGLTLTVALEPDSPAVDHIPVGRSCPPSDQRGVRRPQGPACDIGAFEMTAADGLRVMTYVINSFHLNQTLQVTLDGELQTALTAIDQGQIKVACASLDIFNGEVKLKTGHGITSTQATQLLNEATVIKARIGC